MSYILKIILKSGQTIQTKHNEFSDAQETERRIQAWGESTEIMTVFDGYDSKKLIRPSEVAAIEIIYPERSRI
ncbi:MAG: hypothetical protein ACOX63_03200 [Christensenellales bacterium]|jgi:hypothetical protein